MGSLNKNLYCLLQEVERGYIMHYNLKKILNENCRYNIIIGLPCIGKTYSILKFGLENFIKHGEQMAYIRRRPKEIHGLLLFDIFVKNGEIEKMTNGKYNDIYYHQYQWHLCRVENGKRMKTDENPFCYGFSISKVGYTTIDYFPNITTICFDEFLTYKYLPNEFLQFMDLIYHITQNRNNVKIFMLDNPVDWRSPYFSEMGIKNIQNMKQGTIAVSTYGSGKFKIAVEMCKEGGD